MTWHKKSLPSFKKRAFGSLLVGRQGLKGLSETKKLCWRLMTIAGLHALFLSEEMAVRRVNIKKTFLSYAKIAKLRNKFYETTKNCKPVNPQPMEWKSAHSAGTTERNWPKCLIFFLISVTEDMIVCPELKSERITEGALLQTALRKTFGKHW